MDLTSAEAQDCYDWLLDHVDAEQGWKDNLAYRVSTMDLYGRYKSQVQVPVSLEDFWSIIRIMFPFVAVVGDRGKRCFSAMRIKNVSK